MPRLAQRRKYETSPAEEIEKDDTDAKTKGPPPKVSRTGLYIPIPKRPTVAGNVLVCGQGDLGQLGLGEDESKMERKNPALLPSVSSAVQVCAGGIHNLILTSDGKVYSFGCNDEGALGRDTSKEGAEFEPGEVKLPVKAVKLSAGDSHSACLLEDGRVFAWGSFRDSHGNMGLTIEGNKREPTDILPGMVCADIASGADHLVMLTQLGKVYTVGCGEQGQLGRVSLRTATGQTRRGKKDLLTPNEVHLRSHKLIVQVWATNYCTFMREYKTENIWACGLNNYQQVVPIRNVEMAIYPVMTKLKDIKEVTGGQHHSLFLSNDGKVYVIGRANYGRLGLGEITGDISTLRLVDKIANKKFSTIACGEAQSFALGEDGKLHVWGMGTSCSLGTGSEEDRLEPVVLTGKQVHNKRLLSVSSGGQHSIFIVADDQNKENDDEVTTTTSTTTTNKKNQKSD